MTLSMTAFARYEEHTALGNFSWEIRSVNHRYLEVSFRLEESFRPFEMAMRKLLADNLSRGKVEVSLRYRASEQQQNTIAMNNDLALTVIDSYQQLAAQTENAMPLDLMKVMQWPGVIQTETIDQDALQSVVLSSLKHAVDDLVATRAREGAELQTMIQQRCEQINEIAEQTKTRLPEILASHRQKLRDRIAELEVNLDSERLEQEMVILAQKADVAEEIDRLQSHVKEVSHTMQRDEPIGRRLDFLMQELNREANTLGSKSIDTDTTRYSVDLKVLIEQMREQIQNIE